MTSSSVYILGISAYYHDSAAALLRDGVIVAAAQEERFSRKKHDPGFPSHAVAYCFKEAGITAKDLHSVVFYDKPWVKFERLMETYLSYAPRGLRSFLAAMPMWIKHKLFMGKDIRRQLDTDAPVLFAEHHQSHAASAFYPSPFEQAAVLTVDGVGEWPTSSWAVGKGHELEIKQEIHFPHSLGLLYSAFTYYTGFKVNSGEYKVMGLAPYGKPRFVETILDELFSLREDGSFQLKMDRFSFAHKLTMTDGRFDKVFGGAPRKPESDLTQREMDLAASVQVITEMALEKMVRHIHNQTGLDNLCMAGGVALNCVANGKILRHGPFKRLWIQPAAGDAGGALGAAFAGWHQYLDKPRTVSADGDDAMRGSYLGPAYPTEEITKRLQDFGAVFEEIPEAEVPERVAEAICSEKVVGFFHGRMEFGPRALGARSILGDARSTEMQKTMNLKIKYRESFRPFAPSCLEEDIADLFELDTPSPYMLLVAHVTEARRRALSEEEQGRFGLELLNIPKSDLPAITHVDYSARVQSVNGRWNKAYHEIIRGVKARTGIGCIVNTSFNVRGEPIVRTPEDAYRCFMRTDMDLLVLENLILRKQDQPAFDDQGDWREEFELD